MKRKMALLLALLILASQFAWAGADGTQLTFYYNRADQTYDKWSVWLWPEGGEGKAYDFEGVDDKGAFFTLDLPPGVTKVGFIVRYGEWEKKDVDADQFIDVASHSAVQVLAGQTGYVALEGLTSQPNQDQVGQETTKVKIHYRRFNQDYEGWNLWLWPEGGEGKSYQFIGQDDYGVYFEGDLEGTLDVKQMGLIVRLNDWEQKDIEKDRFIALSKVNNQGVLEVYLMQEDEKIYTEVSQVDVAPKVLAAYWLDDKSLELKVSVDLPEEVSASDVLVSANDVAVDIESVTRLRRRTMVVTLKDQADVSKLYQAGIKGYTSQLVDMSSLFDTPAFTEAYTFTGDLGALYTKEQTTFRLWAPTAKAVSLNLFETGHLDDLMTRIPLIKGPQGTWETQQDGDLHGTYYTYTVEVNGQVNEAVDPYAQAVGVNGDRGMVIDHQRAMPEGWLEDVAPDLGSRDDAIIYELHVRDLSSSSDSGIKQAGKFLGVIEEGTLSRDGLPTGLDHMKALGVTHIQFLPIYDYNSLDETKGLSAGFNWGYDPKNYNAPEGTYATNPYDGSVRVKELKAMIQGLHQNGFRVVMDVVYNHTALTHDSNFEKIVPGYYYRKTTSGFSNGSGCGNETASERPMMSKFIQDSTRYWAETYHIDGYRFDLMGLHDIETMNKVAENMVAHDPNFVIHGEGWTGGASPLSEAKRLVKANAKYAPLIGVFNDDFRDGLKGHVFNATEAGFINGGIGFDESVKFGVVGAIDHQGVNFGQVMYSKVPYAQEPYQSVNYVSAHDNLTLYDKWVATRPDLSQEDYAAMQKLAAGIVLTSQGTPFIHAGAEMMRSKEGDHNSYKSPDAINQLKWSQVKDHAGVVAFYQDMIALRKSLPVLSLGSAQAVRDQLVFYGQGDLPTTIPGLVAFVVEGQEGQESVLVAYNVSGQDFDLPLPQGDWTQRATESGIDATALKVQTSVTVKDMGMVVLSNPHPLVLAVDLAGSNGQETTKPDLDENQDSQTSPQVYVLYVSALVLILGVSGYLYHKKSK